jgi:type 2 lantibiotic biosynthesis protein LanM
VSEAAWRDLERALAGRLVALAGRAVEADFDAHRGGRPDAFAVRLASLRARPETGLYRSFVETQLADGLAGWERRWPVLARLTAITVEGWVRNSVEMIRRLRDEEDFGSVLRIAAGLSDPHDGGRSVHVLTFSGERRRVYKPRGLGLEADFAALLGWCNERGLSLELRGARAVDRGSHGWMDFIAPEPCPDEAAVHRFHRRAGMLLGLLHAFGARDCHCENLVAHGEHPMLIDLEAWLPARLRKWLGGEGLGAAWYEAAARLERGVLSTGLLPRWQRGRRHGELRNVGALGGGQPGQRLAEVWLNVNSDWMVRVWREVETPAEPNVPTLDGRPVEPGRFTEDVVAGFSEMYALLLRHRRELIPPAGPLRGLAGRTTRLVFRSTAAYHRLLERSLRPPCCHDFAARDAALAALAPAYLAEEGRPAAWPLLAAERAALEQGDIPLFRIPVDGTRIEIPGGEPAEGALEMSSLAALRENLAGLGEDDLRLQLGFIRAALTPGGAPSPGPHEDSAALPGPDRLVRAAAAIAARLCASAVRGTDGSLAWIGPRYLPADDVYELTVLGADLYGGTAGIALFLAACGSHLEDATCRDLALRAIAPLRQAPPEAWQRLRLGIGGLTGIASILYAFLWIGELLGEPELAQEALGRSALLTPERIAEDEDLDVVSGSAGAILALLALDEVAPGPNPAGRTALEIAGECADHLLSHHVAADGDHPRGWPSRGDPPLAGFSHGAAGICHALLRLSARTGRRDLREAALEGLAFERGLYSPKDGNWRDPRRPRERPQATWCHGAPGIALARLGILHLLDDPVVREKLREEIRIALETTRSQPLSAIDHLCCGNLGRAEILHEASVVLGDPAGLAEAREIAGRVLLRAERSGQFGCAPFGGSALTDLSLFRGEAGIGLALLRLAGVEGLPCVLRLEGPPARAVQSETAG